MFSLPSWFRRGDDGPLTPSMRTQCSTGQTRKVAAFAQVSA
jgi:hypothetical protein